MKWMNRRRSDNIEDNRGKTGGGGIAGGGIAFFGLGLLVYLLGGDPSMFLQEGFKRSVGSGSVTESKIPQEQQDKLVEFVSIVLADTEETWQKQFQDVRQQYENPKLVFFTGGVSSACGQAQSAMGPFYCPLDQKIYIDLDFFYDLENRHNAAGDFAQAYVIAHEVGHHVQNQLGVLEKSHQEKSRLNSVDANKISVKTELMADCLAGNWAYNMSQKNLLEDGDIEEALKAASQIGDDRLQEQAQGYAVPDSFTHGSASQRYAAFHQGFETGKMQTCIETYRF